MEEIWKDIEGYEGLYQISNLGKVKSIRFNKERLLKYDKSTSYLRIKLCKDGIETNYLIHRLVAKAFIPNPDNKPQVNHIDGIKTNNSVDNLEWCTASENQTHALKTKLIKTKLTEEQVLEIIASNLTQKELANKYSIKQPTISRIKNNKRWSHL